MAVFLGFLTTFFVLLELALREGNVVMQHTKYLGFNVIVPTFFCFPFLFFPDRGTMEEEIVGSVQPKPITENKTFSLYFIFGAGMD